ncbi:MAG: hydrogenase formation protein HypD [Planctomycetaceae bacterium]|nr:hydrogenase formation protein HypD [Planctomycetaceae bacterium]
MLERVEQAKQTIQQACTRMDRPIQIMEVCGTHTVAIFRHGIRSLLPPQIKLLSGPGCPVCVTDQGYIDIVLELAGRDDVILATYGDMMRVPGRAGTLERLHKPEIKVVLSTDDALALAQKHPDKTVVFAAVGFETTTPASAVAVADAASSNLHNFCILSGHKLVVPAMQALLGAKNDKIDAFMCPGHVSVILGSDAYKPVAERFHKPCVVAGFEAVQIMEGIAAICKQMAEGRGEVESVYGAAVTPQGNRTAQAIIDNMFEPYDGPWRGLGFIPGGSLRLRPRYQRFDALHRFGISEIPAEELGGCQCGRVLCGLIDPPQCPLFARKCTPDSPIGPCMVSTEGACSAWYKYGKH